MYGEHGLRCSCTVDKTRSTTIDDILRCQCAFYADDRGSITQKPMTSCGRAAKNGTATAGGDDVPGSSTTAVKCATDSTDRYDYRACHRGTADVDDAQSAVSVGSGNPSADVRRVQKSVSFRAEPRRPGEVDGDATSRVLPRPRQGTDQRHQQHVNQSAAFTVAPRSRRDVGVSDGNKSSGVRRDENDKRDGGASKRSQSQGPAGRSSAGGLKTSGSSVVADEQLKLSLIHI